jgi:hypothetical protein
MNHSFDERTVLDGNGHSIDASGHPRDVVDAIGVARK